MTANARNEPSAAREGLGSAETASDTSIVAKVRPGAGAFVVVVGPDGAGKTSVARELIAQHGGSTAYFHFLPSIWGTLLSAPPDIEVLPSVNKGGPTGSRVTGCLRLANSAARAWLAHASRVRPALRRGTLVVGDRWIYGYVAQPEALRFYGPTWLAVAVIRLLPRPHLVVNLTAAPEVIRSRKQELSLQQITVELAAWSRLPEPRTVTIAASEPPQRIARRILDELGL
jgi:thymidylate kinase